MKKIYLLFIFFCFMLNMSAKEMHLYCNDIGDQEFEGLTIVEQYTSYINSFRYIMDPREQPIYWVKKMVVQYGKDVLPLIEKDILNNSFNHLYREPYDSILGLIAYILSELERKKLLAEEDVKKYRNLYEKKIDDYIMDFKVIDGTVNYGIICTEQFAGKIINVPRDSKELKRYYEKKLGITGVIAGNLKSTWE